MLPLLCSHRIHTLQQHRLSLSLHRPVTSLCLSLCFPHAAVVNSPPIVSCCGSVGKSPRPTVTVVGHDWVSFPPFLLRPTAALLSLRDPVALLSLRSSYDLCVLPECCLLPSLLGPTATLLSSCNMLPISVASCNLRFERSTGCMDRIHDRKSASRAF